MTEAEKTSILEWMDKQIELDGELEATEDFNDIIGRCDVKRLRRIHIYELAGVKSLAEAAGLKASYQSETDDLPAVLCFTYRGYKFFSLTED